MKHLSALSPAETLLVLRDKNASIKEILKVTFMDLLLKQVLRTFEAQGQPSKKDAVGIYKYVEAGKNFVTYKPLQHENIFLAPFKKSASVQILFRNMVKMGYQNAKSQYNIHNMLRRSPNLDRCFSRSIIQSLTGGFSLTEDGKKLRKQLENERAQLETQLPPLIVNDHQKALDILKVIKGNIFLLSNIELDSLKQIDKELLAEMNKRDYHNDDDSFLDSFDFYSDSFDSGCGGGSGCSGCSGCGGD